MDLVGREREIDALGRLLEQAVGGRGGVLVIVGAAGSGKSALLDAACEMGRAEGFSVLRSVPARGQPGRFVWAQLLRDVDAPLPVQDAVLGPAGVLDLDTAARFLTGQPKTLIAIDDIDRGGAAAVELLGIVAARSSASGTAAVVTSSVPLGIEPEMTLRGLEVAELGQVVDPLPAEVLWAVWFASRGRPGPASQLVGELARVARGSDPVAHLALHMASSVSFLDVDVTLVALLELALARPVDDATRARLLGRLARELLGDHTAALRRRALVDDATRLARSLGDGAVLGEVLHARLHALWDPAGVQDRLDASSEIVELAIRHGDTQGELRGRMWRFAALTELGRVQEAEAALVAYARAGTAVGDREATATVTARYAMLAAMRGRFREARQLTAEFREMG